MSQWADRLVCSLMRHWLALLLMSGLVFVTLPFLAPVAIHVGWPGLGEAIHWLYRPFCHQLPQRSWFLFGEKLTYTPAEINRVYPYTDVGRLRLFYGTPELGWKVAWSDRMISFYMMTPVFGLVYAALRQSGRRIRPIAWKTLLIALAPLAIDGMTHVMSDLLYGVSAGGFRDTNDWMAFLTGSSFAGFYVGDQFGTFNWWMRLFTGILAAWGLAFFTLPWLDRRMGEERRRCCGVQTVHRHGSDPRSG